MSEEGKEREVFEIIYNGQKINNNQYLKPFVASSKPIIHCFVKEKLYTLIIHDPDAPVGNVVHWVKMNMSASSPGNEIIKYKGPAPPMGSGIHRYMFLFYEQEREMKLEKEIEKERVVPMNKLLLQLGLTNKKPVYTMLFKSSYDEKGGKKKKKTLRKKFNRIIRKKSRRRYR